MALPVLDGNQTATTLSSVVTGGEHIVAHSVVSLGTNAIANITSAVSGSVVSISNFPSTQTIAGTVTANANNFGFEPFEDLSVSGKKGIVIGYEDDSSGEYRRVKDSEPLPVTINPSGAIPAISGTVTANTAYAVSVTGIAGFAAGTVTAIPVALVDRGVYGGNLLGYNGTNTYLNTAIESVGGNSLRAGGTFPVSGSVTIGSLPAISGTVTIGAIGGAVTIPVRLFAEREGAAPTGEDTLLQCNSSGALLVDLRAGGESAIGYDGDAFLQVKQVAGSSVTIGSLPAISGTVTARLQDGSGNNLTSTTIGGSARLNVTLASATTTGVALPAVINVYGGSDGGTVRAIAVDSGGRTVVTGTISGIATSVTARLINPAGTAVTYAEVGTAGSPSIDVLSVQGVPGGTSLPISGTAGTLTTRFGTPTTANTAFATTAVTNTSRRYLLIQNVTTGANVITVGIGFTPTTTQGIQLTAGAGITFESSYIPTGQVFVLSSVTASNFTILEA